VLILKVKPLPPAGDKNSRYSDASLKRPVYPSLYIYSVDSAYSIPYRTYGIFFGLNRTRCAPKEIPFDINRISFNPKKLPDDPNGIPGGVGDYSVGKKGAFI
jgi:hypothetical protein